MRELQAIEASEGADLQRRDRMLLVVTGRSGRSEMEDPVDVAIDIQLCRDVSLHEAESTGPHGCDVASVAGQERIHADDGPTLRQEAIAQVRADESGSPRDDGAAGLHRSGVGWRCADTCSLPSPAPAPGRDGSGITAGRPVG